MDKTTMDEFTGTIKKFEKQQGKIKTKEEKKAHSVLKIAKKAIGKKEVDAEYMYGNINWLLKLYFKQ